MVLAAGLFGLLGYRKVRKIRKPERHDREPPRVRRRCCSTAGRPDGPAELDAPSASAR